MSLGNKTGNSGSIGNEHVLQLIREAIIKTSTSGGGSTIADLLQDIVDTVPPSGVYIGDVDGIDTSVLRLRRTEDDETTGITYIGYSTTATTEAATTWVLERITLTIAGDVESNDMEYAVDSWDNRATATYV